MSVNPQMHAHIPVYSDETSDDVVWAMNHLQTSEIPFGVIGNKLVTKLEAVAWLHVFSVLKTLKIGLFGEQFVKLPLHESIKMAMLMSDEFKNA